MNNHSVKLIAVTEPKNKEMTAEQLLAYIARVSNPKNQDNHDTATKLLKYLIEHKHWSPFDMIDVIIEVECTRDIGRQILRHWSYRFQEFSQRYAAITKDMFAQNPFEARLQDPKNRQNSTSTNDETIQNEWNEIQEDSKNYSMMLYEKASKLGIAKELARKVLPEGLTMSKMYMKGSLRSWIFYSMVRIDPTAQKEHRDIAIDCWKLILEEFPSLHGIFNYMDINVLQDNIYANSSKNNNS